MLQCGFEIFFQMLLHGFICTVKYRRLHNNFPYVKSYFNILNRIFFFPPVETIDTFLQASDSDFAQGTTKLQIKKSFIKYTL